MSVGTDTVHGRITRFEPTRTQLLGLTLAVLLGAVLLFAQTPMLHDSMHNFRHAAGITCH
ncbi:CbtB domain-containing protein [Halobacterium jilantaiense]|uniref:Cobalt transporter subunit CbtB n=1 Tax=Halobacterium jilantaiense TaxID=355548 RepID=A0A1I0QNY9_9EURY|nr:CbtB domain-containing protein [Halobacterium jilantaiense]SEW28519.1 cobalt transporter subunit CbtB [Halobacterium jilantaiense]